MIAHGNVDGAKETSRKARRIAIPGVVIGCMLFAASVIINIAVRI